MMATIAVREKGRLFLPAALREEVGIQPGDEVIARVENGRLVLESRASVLARLRGAVADQDDRVSSDLVRAERDDDLARAAAKQERVARRLAEASDAEVAERGTSTLQALGIAADT